MPRALPPHLVRERTRHGVWVYYVRRWHGGRVRVRAPFDSAEFWAEYRAALEGAPPPKRSASPQTLRWAIDLYRSRPAWAALAVATRRQREAIYRTVTATAGDELLGDISTQAIRDGRDRRAATPHGANNFLKAIRGLFGWLISEGLIGSDPTKGVTLLRGPNDKFGFHTWTEEELERFERRWPVGSRQRLAYDVLLYTGFRRGDAVRLGRQHIRRGHITLRTEKTGEEVTIPVLKPLADSIAATRTGDLTLLVTEAGAPWVKESFGNWFREACRAAGCPGSAHGLRKAGAERAALNGATVNQLMAMFGWTTAKMAIHYTEKADRRRLAQAGSELLLPARLQNETARTHASGAGGKAKKSKRSGA